MYIETILGIMVFAILNLHKHFFCSRLFQIRLNSINDTKQSVFSNKYCIKISTTNLYQIIKKLLQIHQESRWVSFNKFKICVRIHYTVPKEIDFPRYNMKCSRENVILRGIFPVVKRFPLHFMLYRENWDYFSNSVALSI